MTEFSDYVAGALKKVAGAKRYPASVYRIQFGPSLRFADATRLVAYLHDLGITDCYCSPYLQARPGSLHGYDIVDHNSLNAELGTEADYIRFVRELRRLDMGQIIDFVPNHMGIFSNPKWFDVLENGPSSIYARYFDIDWQPAKQELHEKVLLPILEDLYGTVLESGRLVLALEDGAFVIRYGEHRLPVGPKTWGAILAPSSEALREVLGETHGGFIELQSIMTACKNLPERRDTREDRILERHREVEVIKRRLRQICTKTPEIAAAIGATVRSFHGSQRDSATFARLHDLLESQAYRLSYWRVAADEINYRRFFDINELAALRMEDHVVFHDSHRLVRELVANGSVTGVRIDHVDGLFDPSHYLKRLQRACWIDLIRSELAGLPEFAETDPDVLDAKLSDYYDSESATAHGGSMHPLYLVVEKILGNKEETRTTWPVDGTTGYEFLTALEQMFVDSRHRRAMIETYRSFTGLTASFRDIVYQCKKLVLSTAMAAELTVLGHLLNRVSERTWQYRDFTLNSLTDAIGEIIACFPVYRTYIDAPHDVIDERDRLTIDAAVREAKRRNPAVNAAIFDFVRHTLLLQYPSGMSGEGHDEQCLFVMRFQQFTGPVMAKGMEDTAFYVYNPLLSLCEVGGNPDRFGGPVEEFHRQNVQRRRSQPHSLITTSTHDSKRSQDIRARIDVLSEVPEEWRTALRRWGLLNRSKKTAIGDEVAPDSNEEYLIYQTLVGTYPTSDMGQDEQSAYTKRIQQYVLKSVREAKVHSSWINPNVPHENAVTGFVQAILSTRRGNRFMTEFKELNAIAATCGMYNSLSQTVLKVLSPGVPDIYQGEELWAFNLADPDNRRPVDFDLRREMLKALRKETTADRNRAAMASTLLNSSDKERLKLYVTWRSLEFRRDNSSLFFGGSYSPLEAAGARKSHVCSFSWKKGRQEVIVVVPRLTARLTRNASFAPLGREAWQESTLLFPRRARLGTYRNIFTDETISVPPEAKPSLPLADVFSVFPVAVLQTVND